MAKSLPDRDLPTRSWAWLWRARHVLNSIERAELARYAVEVQGRYAPEVAVLRRRLALRVLDGRP